MSAELKKLAGELRGKLADVESELRHSDGVEKRIGETAGEMRGKIRGSLEERRKRLAPFGNDPKDEDDYLYLAEQHHRLNQVEELAGQNEVPKV